MTRDGSNLTDGGSIGGTPSPPTYKAEVSGTGSGENTLPVSVNTDTGNATTDIGSQAEDIFAGTEGAVITVPSIPGVSSYTLEIPADSLSGSEGESTLTFFTNMGSITIPAGMLEGMPEIEGKKAAITIGQGDKSDLPEEVQSAIGDRPLVQLTLTLDGEQTEWNNPDAPVTVSIPYTPTAEELENPESIVVWYIDGSGNVISIPNGRYDPETRTVTFTTTHFSYYAVGYKPVSFKDVPEDALYAKAVSFIAAREITLGTGNGNFSPEGKLTRAQFIVMLMRTYGIAPDANPEDNFADAGDIAPWAVDAMKLLVETGTVSGSGNRLSPKDTATRAQMAQLLYNLLSK